jgi:hypothetical protein
MKRAPFSPAFLVALGMVAAGVVGGWICDPHPARPPAYRAGYRVLEGDFHAHTAWSDGSLSPITMVRQANRRGLDIVSVTEHNTVYPSYIARWYAEQSGGPVALLGEEVTTKRFHVITLGITKTVSPNQPLENVLADIHAQQGIAIAAHPVEHFWADLLPMRAKFDGAEVMHPIAYSSARAEWRWEDMLKFYDESELPLAAIGSSDYHWGSVLGLCRTLVFVKEPVTESSILEAIRAKRTATIDLQGKAHGAPELVEALRVEPYAPRTSDYKYHGASTTDRVLRAVGFFGLLGTLLLRARRR